MEHFYRRLPHWQPTNGWMFVTWRLAGSLPRDRDIIPPDLPAGRRFVLVDAQVDRASTGPVWLKDPRIAQIVEDRILELESRWYDLAAWVVMANHVHVVISPSTPIARIMHDLKGSTAYAANKVLRRTGRFWAVEYYDHALRSPESLNRAIRYVETNPVKAGLVDRIEDFPWSSAKRTG